MNKCRIFLNPIEGREDFINAIAEKGYRLVKSGSLIHKFEKTDGNFTYAVQYIGYMNNKERKEYLDFLNDLDLRTMDAPLNIGKFSLGNVRLRPYNPPKSMVATSPGMINKEILIIESNGQEKLPIFTDKEGRNEDLDRRKAPYRYLALVAAFLCGLRAFGFSDNRVGIVGFILLVFSLINQIKLNSMKKD